MTSQDDLLQDNLLQKLATGELSPGDEPALSLLDTSEEFRQRWTALQKLQTALGGAATERRAHLDEVSTPTDAAFEEAALARAREVFGTGAAPALRRVPALRIALAASLLFGFGLWLSSLPARLPRAELTPPPTLGQALVLIAPVGAVERYDEFQWEYALKPGLHFEVSLWDEQSGQELWTSPRLHTPRFSPPSGLELPARLRWEVWVLDDQGGHVAMGASEAFLSR